MSAPSLIVTSNKAFSAWGEIFGDDVVAAAMIDRLVHHAEILALKATPTASKTATSPDTLSASDARGERRSGLARRSRLHAARHGPPGGPLFDRRYRHISTGLDTVAFKNPDGSIVAVIYNSGAAKTSIVSIGGKKLQCAVPGNGWATVNYTP